MAREIIVLDTTVDGNGNQNIRYLFWLAVGANKQLPNPTAVSSYRGATVAELASLQSGATVEVLGSTQYPNGTAVATIEADLQARWSTANTAFQALPNLNQFFGASWDGTTWTAAPTTPPPIQPSRYQTGAINVAASGDNTVIAGIANQGVSIFRMKMVAAAAVTATIKDGVGTTLFGPFAMAAGIPEDFPWAHNDEPWFVTSAGNAFIVNLSSAVSVAIRGSFSRG
jgi:hypothetical protein